VFYVLMTGCQWRALPKDLPPKSTVHEYLGLWEWDGTLARIDPSGYDAGNKVKGKKQHIVVDTLGMILAAHIQPADVQERDGALPALKEVRRLFPFIERVFADSGYQRAATAAAVREPVPRDGQNWERDMVPSSPSYLTAMGGAQKLLPCLVIKALGSCPCLGLRSLG
jgi:transposase